jgi:hypothetical protein
MVLETLGVVLVFGTIGAALQFEGKPDQEGHAASDEGGGLLRDARSTERLPAPFLPTRLSPAISD